MGARHRGPRISRNTVGANGCGELLSLTLGRSSFEGI
jgi:hypothetical protein